MNVTLLSLWVDKLKNWRKFSLMLTGLWSYRQVLQSHCYSFSKVWELMAEPVEVTYWQRMQWTKSFPSCISPWNKTASGECWRKVGHGQYDKWFLKEYTGFWSLSSGSVFVQNNSFWCTTLQNRRTYYYCFYYYWYYYYWYYYYCCCCL